MYLCECGREFTTLRGLRYHEKFCGKNRIFLDNSYECKIGPDGNIVYIHREVMEQKLGRKLKPGELVHHKDENKRNNHPGNLELSDRGSHLRKHGLHKDYPNRVRGSRVGTSILIEEQVGQIKLKLKNGSKPTNLARDYGVHPNCIFNIKYGCSWKHIQVPL